MQEKLFFKDSEGNRVCGVISATDKSRPIIILCHGFTSSKESNTNLELEKILNKNDISTFRIDLFAHGESDGRMEDITVSRAVDDILGAISFLKQRGYKKFGLVGSSFGGIASMLAASKTNDIFVLALKCPVSNFEELALGRVTEEMLGKWKEKGHIDYEPWDGFKISLKYSFFDDMKNNNGYEAAKNVKVPTIIVHGDDDTTVPVEQSKKTAELIKDCRLEIIRGAGHDFSKNPEHFRKMIELIAGFIVGKS